MSRRTPDPGPLPRKVVRGPALDPEALARDCQAYASALVDLIDATKRVTALHALLIGARGQASEGAMEEGRIALDEAIQELQEIASGSQHAGIRQALGWREAVA